MLFIEYFTNSLLEAIGTCYNFSIYFSTLEFNTGPNVSMAMKTTLEQDHFGMGRKLVQTKFMVEHGQT